MCLHVCGLKPAGITPARPALLLTFLPPSSTLHCPLPGHQQLLVLYSFPAICWAYGAGPLFSSFVSLVFWTG